MYLNDYCCILLHSILKYRQKGSDSMTTVSLRFDDEMKKQLDEMCDEMGMNLTTFFMIYAKTDTKGAGSCKDNGRIGGYGR